MMNSRSREWLGEEIDGEGKDRWGGDEYLLSHIDSGYLDFYRREHTSFDVTLSSDC